MSAQATGAGDEDDLIEDAPEIVAFDVGEVLIDESRLWGVWADLLGVSHLTFAAVLGAAVAQGFDHHEAFPVVAPNIDWEQLRDEHERRLGGLGTQDLYPDVRPCLTALQEMGFRVAIAGNQPALRHAQLLGMNLPHDVMAMSEAMGAEKPSLAFYEGLLELTGAAAPDRVLYVGDRVDNDVLPAAAFGMRTCWLRRGPWGRLQDLPDDAPEPDLVLDGLGELPQLLNDWRGPA